MPVGEVVDRLVDDRDIVLGHEASDLPARILAALLEFDAALDLVADIRRDRAQHLHVALLDIGARAVAEAAQAAVHPPVAAAQRHAEMRAHVELVDHRQARGVLVEAGIGDALGQLALDHQPAQAVVVGVVIARSERRPPACGDVGEDPVRGADLTRDEGNVHVEPRPQRLEHIANLLARAGMGHRGGVIMGDHGRKHQICKVAHGRGYSGGAPKGAVTSCPAKLPRVRAAKR